MISQMIPYTALRKIFKIPLVRENKEAVHILNKLFYLLIALHRLRRYREFSCLSKIYFRMIDSFALYGLNESKETINLLLGIHWFNERRHDLYRTISVYRQLIKIMDREATVESPLEFQAEFNEYVATYFFLFKLLIQFDEKDEERITFLMKKSSVINNALDDIFMLLG